MAMGACVWTPHGANYRCTLSAIHDLQNVPLQSAAVSACTQEPVMAQFCEPCLCCALCALRCTCSQLLIAVPNFVKQPTHHRMLHRGSYMAAAIVETNMYPASNTATTVGAFVSDKKPHYEHMQVKLQSPFILRRQNCEDALLT